MKARMARQSLLIPTVKNFASDLAMGKLLHKVLEMGVIYLTLPGPVEPISQATANAGQQRLTQVNAGPQQPTKTNAGPRRRKRFRYVFFCNVHFIAFYQLFIFYFLITMKPTKAHSSQRRPMQAHAE